MGNSGSCSQGSVYIQTDQPFYIAGDTVTGKVHINMLEMYSANMLELKIKGFEESYWVEQRTRERRQTGADGVEKISQETYYETHRGKNVFYCHKFPLYVWSQFNYMPAGQYTFPFQFKLLDSLPGSFYEAGTEQNGDYKATIKYKVKAFINGGQNKMLKNKQELVVREPLKNLVQAQYGEKLVKPNTWCCVSQGQSHLKCHFEKNIYVPGETARMLADIDNSQCDLAVTRLTCNFVKRLRLTSSQGRELLVVRNVQSRSFDGVGPRQAAIDQNRKSCEINLSHQNGNSLQPSTKGRLVNCEYTLNMTASLSGCICCSSVPAVTVPITIVSPPPMNYGVVATPPNWNPQVFEIKTFAFNSDGMYTKNVPSAININMNIPNIMPPPNMNMNVNVAPQPNFAPQQPNFAPQQPNFAPQQPNFAPQQPNFAPQQPNFAPGMQVNISGSNDQLNTNMNDSNQGLQMNIGFQDNYNNNSQQANIGFGVNFNNQQQGFNNGAPPQGF